MFFWNHANYALSQNPFSALAVYVNAICGFNDLDRQELSQKFPEEEMDVKEEEMQSQIPFHWSTGRDHGDDSVEQQSSPQSKQLGDRSYIENLEAEVSRLDHEVTRLQVHSNLLETQARLSALQDTKVHASRTVRHPSGHVSCLASKPMVSVASQTDTKPMEDLQGYQQLCEIVGYVFTDIGRAHSPHDVAEALHPLLKKLCGKNLE
ncbi:hypothetical protein EV361DRAFT_954628 [Lentinula raphanica]|nr:hypothetical protein EV361DRAFT_954628 [Lentinula raphanica]